MTTNHEPRTADNAELVIPITHRQARPGNWRQSQGYHRAVFRAITERSKLPENRRRRGHIAKLGPDAILETSPIAHRPNP